MPQKKEKKTFLCLTQQGVCWSIFFFLIFLLYGCGFQLNRNRIQLPNQATSISISKIENRSYVPQLDMTLRHQLIEDFNAQSIALKLTNQADLVLSFEIRSYQIKRTDYALDKTGQTYDFRFTISGSLSVFDNREKTFYLSSQTLSSTYSYITESTDLTIAETDDGRDELIDLLSKAIAEKLTDRF